MTQGACLLMSAGKSLSACVDETFPVILMAIPANLNLTIVMIASSTLL